MASLTTAAAIINIGNGLILNSGTADAHLITSAPSSAAATGADLTVATGGNAGRMPVTLTTATADGTGGAVRTTASTITWTSLYTSGTNIIGIAFTKRAGASYASTDKFFSYIEFDTAYTPLTSVGQDFVFTIPAAGLLKGVPV